MELQKQDQILKQESSMELSKLAKGNYVWKIKCFNEDLNKAREILEQQDAALSKKYGGVTGDE